MPIPDGTPRCQWIRFAKTADIDTLRPGEIAIDNEASTFIFGTASGNKTLSETGLASVEVALAGGLSGDGTSKNPLRINTDNMSENPAPGYDFKLALVNATGVNIEFCTIGKMLSSVVSGDVTFDSMGAATVDFPAPPAPDMGSATGILAVPNGGSGVGTLTGYLIGNGTAAFTASKTIPAADITGLGAMASVASVTLSGDATGSGTSSIAVTIPNDTVTFAKMQNINPKTVLGRGNTGTVGDVTQLTAGNTGLNLLAADTPPAARTTLGLGDLAQLNQFPGFTFGHVALTSNTADIGTSWVDVGLTSSSLTAGHYDIVLDYRYIINSTTSAYVEFRLVDSLGAVIQDNPGDSIRFAFSTNQASVTLQGTSSVHWVWTAGAGQTFKLQARCTTAGGGTTTPVQLRGSSIGYTIMRWRRVY